MARKIVVTPEDMAKTLFKVTTVDERLCWGAWDLFANTTEPIFEARRRDITAYSALLPTLDALVRDDLKILRIELMHFAFAVIDYFLMRSQKLHDEFGARLCLETVHWYVWEFKGRVEPLGKSDEFLDATEARLKAYNDAWTVVQVEGIQKHRMLFETLLFGFCEPTAPVINVVLYVALQAGLIATQNAVMDFFHAHTLVEGPSAK